MRLLATLVLAGFLLAGCSGGKDPAPADSGPQADFTDLDLAATSTTGLIRGIVVDQAIRPIANATVALSPGGLPPAKTNAAGAFGFDDLEPGTYFLQVSKLGYNATQTSTEVVAGLAEPPIVKVLLAANPSEIPYFESYAFDGFMTCGFSLIETSAGCDTLEQTAEPLGDHIYFPLHFTTVPSWIQGELVWEQTQAAGGMMLWQLAGCADTDTDALGSHYCDGPPAQESPALTFVGTEKIQKNNDSMLKDGVQFNMFGGPHPMCNQVGYGCGVVLQQKFQVFAHALYNFVPPEGWRFTSDGDPPIPV